MKKLILILLLALGLSAMGQTFTPHPALCYTRTGQADPAFIIYITPDWIQVGDYFGVYSAESMLCYGSKARITDTNNVVQMPCFIDEQMTSKVDGFEYGEQMLSFYYNKTANKFYQLQGTFYSYADVKTKNTKSSGIRTVSVVSGTPILPTKVKASSLSIYLMDNLVKGNEIELCVDPDLSAVVLSFTEKTITVKTGGVEKIELPLTSQNVSGINVFKATGSGTIEMDRFGKYYYNYTSTDAYVVINVVGKNNFTGELLTDQIKITLDQSASSNAKYEDANVLIYLKGDKVFLKIKAEKASVNLFRFEKGIRKKMYNSGTKTQGFEQAFINGQYNRWKGIGVTIEYTYYINGKMANTVKTVNGKPVIEPVVKTFVL